MMMKMMFQPMEETICHRMAPEGIMIAMLCHCCPSSGRREDGRGRSIYVLPTVCLSTILPLLANFEWCCTDDDSQWIEGQSLHIGIVSFQDLAR